MKMRQPVYTDGEEPLSKEEVNSVLRHAGYDPEEVGKKMDIVARQALKIAQLEADLKLRPSVKLSDGDAWLVFPNAMISIEGICKFGMPGPIVRRNLRKWRDELLKDALGGE